MDYLKVYFIEENGYYGGFLMKNNINMINALLNTQKQSYGILLTDTLDCFYLNSKGSYINEVSNLSIIDEFNNSKNEFSNSEVILLNKNLNVFEVLNRLDNNAINTDNIVFVNNLEELEPNISIENIKQPLISFSWSSNPIQISCQCCNNYQYICGGELLCPHYKLELENIYAAMTTECILNDLNNNFIIMKMYSDLEGMDNCFNNLNDSLNKELNSNKPESYRLETLRKMIKDYNFAKNLSNDDIEILKQKYKFNEKMYINNFNYDEVINEIHDYYYNKVLNIEKKFKEAMNTDKLNSFLDEIYYDDDKKFFIIEDILKNSKYFKFYNSVKEQLDNYFYSH